MKNILTTKRKDSLTKFGLESDAYGSFRNAQMTNTGALEQKESEERDSATNQRIM